MTDEQRAELIAQACASAARAYAPYSNFPVGAALLGASGRIYTGVNVENAAYPAGICAERTAVFKAVSEGEQTFLAIAVVSRTAGSPCGMCRQVLSEFGVDTKVVIADLDGTMHRETTVADLLPGAFSAENLQA